MSAPLDFWPWLFIVGEAVAVIVLTFKLRAANACYEAASESLGRLLDRQAREADAGKGGA